MFDGIVREILTTNGVKESLYWGSYFVFPFLGLTAYKFCTLQKFWQKTIAVIIILASLLFVWTRFVEPQIIIIKHTNIEVNWTQPLTAVLIADPHLGVYKGPQFLEKVVTKINTIEADLVLIAGDFVYHSDDLESDFAPLQNINKPVFAVFGNHDAGFPGEDVRTKLATILQQYNVTVLTNQDVLLNNNVVLLGLGSHWAQNDMTNILSNYAPEQNILVMLHNPDSTRCYPVHDVADITVAGHTHCGQIRLPWLYKSQIPTVGNFDGGLTRESNGQLFISCGLGEVGLPLRFLNPPTIDVLHLR